MALLRLSKAAKLPRHSIYFLSDSSDKGRQIVLLLKDERDRERSEAGEVRIRLGQTKFEVVLLQLVFDRSRATRQKEKAH